MKRKFIFNHVPLQRVILLTSIFWGCINKDDFDFGNTEVEISPSIAVPLVNSSIGVNRIISTLDTAFQQVDQSTDSAGLVTFVYISQIFSKDIQDLVVIPDVNSSFALPLDKNITVPDVNLSEDVDLGTLGGGATPNGVRYNTIGDIMLSDFNLEQNSPNTDFEYITYSGGTIGITVSNNFGAPISFDLRLTNISDNSLIGTSSFNVAAGTNQTQQISFASKTVRNQISFNLSNIQLMGSRTNSASVVDVSDQLIISTTTANLVISEASINLARDIDFESKDTLYLNLSTVQLRELLMDGGTIELDISSDISFNSRLDINLPSILNQSNSPLSSSTNLSPSGNSNVNFDLANTRINLNLDASQDYNRVILTYRFFTASGSNIIYRPAETVNVNTRFKNFNTQQIRGYFGNQSLDIGGDTLEVSFFRGTGLTGDFALPDLTIDLTITNDYGVEANLNFTSAKAINIDDQVRNITISKGSDQNIIPILAATNITTPGITTGVTADNTDDLVSFKPIEIIYNASVMLNPSGLSENFLTSDDSLTVDMRVELPLNVSVQNLIFTDTFAFNFPFKEEDVKDLNSGIIRVNTLNSFPVDIAVQAYIVDDDFNIVDSLYNESFEQNRISAAGITNSEGIVIGSTSLDADITVDLPKLQRILKGTKIIVTGTASTSNNSGSDASAPVKILQTYKMTLKMGFFANLTFNISYDN